MHPGKRKRVCKSELYTAYRREHIHVRRKQLDRIDTRIRRGTALLSAAEIIFGRRATRVAPPDGYHANAYALLQLHVTVCLWSWAVRAWELDRQRLRSATTTGRHVVCSSGLVQNTNSSSSDYDTGTSMILQVLVYENHPRASSRPCRSCRSHPGNMCERSGSYRSHPRSYRSQPGKHV